MDEQEEVVVNYVPIKEWSDTLLVKYAAQGNKEAAAEIQRRKFEEPTQQPIRFDA